VASPLAFPKEVHPVARSRFLLGLVALSSMLAMGACSTSTDDTAEREGGRTAGRPGDTAAAAPCPVEAVPIVVSVDQWGDITRHLAGACGDVTTIITGTAGDPHDYEPSPADRATFGRARLVVMNGLGYDEWAASAVESTSPRPEVVDAGVVTGRGDGENPHLWYNPDDVQRVAGAITTALRAALPDASEYLDARVTEWNDALGPYLELVENIRERHAGRRVATTEPVADELFRVAGLDNVTPAGYASSAANESDPAPGDLADFQRLLRDRGADVLVVNTQTEGPLPAQLRTAAEDAGVPVVEVTETIPSTQRSFVDWQIDQLRRLDTTLSEGR
jgi:zinc/manganese transport system substrate-binding protein